jgi:hypothetical protein
VDEAVNDVICAGTWSCAGIMPPWWYMPIRVPRRMLNISQDVQKHFRPRGEAGRRTQVRSKGTQGRRNRGSWCGKRGLEQSGGVR